MKIQITKQGDREYLSQLEGWQGKVQADQKRVEDALQKIGSAGESMATCRILEPPKVASRSQAIANFISRNSIWKAIANVFAQLKSGADYDVEPYDPSKGQDEFFDWVQRHIESREREKYSISIILNSKKEELRWTYEYVTELIRKVRKTISTIGIGLNLRALFRRIIRFLFKNLDDESDLVVGLYA